MAQTGRTGITNEAGIDYGAELLGAVAYESNRVLNTLSEREFYREFSNYGLRPDTDDGVGYLLARESLRLEYSRYGFQGAFNEMSPSIQGAFSKAVIAAGKTSRKVGRFSSLLSIVTLGMLGSDLSTKVKFERSCSTACQITGFSPIED